MEKLKIKAIPTRYAGIEFRSKLEAEWAKFFDAIGIKWVYEPEGFKLSDGTKYMPDFYLPDAHQWFEVKGVMDEIDMHKIKQFILDTGNELIIGYSNGEFQHCEKELAYGSIYDPNDSGCHIAEIYSKEDSYLNECLECGGLSFMNSIMSWHCRCNKCYDGDHYIHWIMCGKDSGYEEIKSSDWLSMARIDVRNN